MPDNTLHAKLSSSFNTEAFYASYRKTFSIVKADTDDLREQAFRLRYEVYCLENKYEDPKQNPGEIEQDLYDQDADHFLLMHNESGRVAGTVRVILPNPDSSEDCFPMQSVCEPPASPQ